LLSFSRRLTCNFPCVESWHNKIKSFGFFMGEKRGSASALTLADALTSIARKHQSSQRAALTERAQLDMAGMADLWQREKRRNARMFAVWLKQLPANHLSQHVVNEMVAQFWYESGSVDVTTLPPNVKPIDVALIRADTYDIAALVRSLAGTQHRTTLRACSASFALVVFTPACVTVCGVVPTGVQATTK
jgi:hypothetical protein